MSEINLNGNIIYIVIDFVYKLLYFKKGKYTNSRWKYFNLLKH